MLMNNKKLSYIEIIKKIDETFPVISEFDYRSLSIEDMWNKVYALISETGLLSKMDSSEIQELKDKIQDYHISILHQANMAAINPEDYIGYSQNNYYIGECVLLMKKTITSLMEQKQMIFFEDIESLDDPNNLGYWNEMGSVDEIRQFIDYDSIHKYVQDHLSFLKMDHQDYDINKYIVLDDICEHFGLEADSEFSDRFYSLFIDALNKSKTLTDRSYYDDKKNEFVREVLHDSSRFNEKLTALIDEVTSYVEINAKKCLAKRIDYEQRKRTVQANGGSWNPSKRLTLDNLLYGNSFKSTSPENNITIIDGDFIHAGENASPDNKRWDATPQAVSDEIKRRFEGHSVTTASPIEPIASGDGYPDVMVDWARPVKSDTPLSPAETVRQFQEKPSGVKALATEPFAPEDVMVDWARPVKPDTSLNNSPTGIDALENNIIIKHKKLQSLILENEAIIGKIKDLTTRMEENLDAIKGIYYGVK